MCENCCNDAVSTVVDSEYDCHSLCRRCVRIMTNQHAFMGLLCSVMGLIRG